MRAVVQAGYGSPDDLTVRDVEKPSTGADEVLVRVRAASLHPDVWHIVCGRPFVLRFMGGGFLKPGNPIPGTDMAGIVEAVGRDVTRFQPGDRVFGEAGAGHPWTNGGAFAEYVAAPQHVVALKPDNVTFEQAASVPTSGLIALQNLRDRSRLGPGRHVLINGAGGGVGTLALQIVKSLGAHVTAVDTTRKLPMLRSLGADEVVDFTAEDFTRRGVRYDLVFDVPGSRPLAGIRRALLPDGRYVPIGHDHFGAAGRRLFGLLPHFFRLMFLARFMKLLRGPGTPLPTKAEVIVVLRDLLAAGTITPVIDSTWPMDEIREAMRHMVHDELLGKVIITP